MTATSRPKQVIQRLIDTVSKNGNLLLSIPVRGNGTLDDKEEKVLAGMADWMAGQRAKRSLHHAPGASMAKVRCSSPTPSSTRAWPANWVTRDIRFTTKDSALYALGMDWPTNGYMTLYSLAEGSPQRKGSVERVELLGSGETAQVRARSGRSDGEIA